MSDAVGRRLTRTAAQTVVCGHARVVALWLLPFWLGWELWNAFGDSRGVAFYAHAGGIMVGALSAYALRALQLTRQIQDRFLESHALNHLGVAELEQGNVSTALEHLLAARKICVTQDIQAENYSGVLGDLALCHLAAGDLPAASQAADELEAIYPQVEAGSQDSQRTLWVIARVRRAAGQLETAAGLVQRAYQLVEERSAAIPELTYRQTYRDLIFNHRIIAAHERGEWPDP